MTLEEALECGMLKNAEAERLIETNKELQKTSEEFEEANKQLKKSNKNLTEKNTELSEKLEQQEALIQQYEVCNRLNIKIPKFHSSSDGRSSQFNMQYNQ